MSPELLINAVFIAAVIGIMLGPDWLVKLIGVGLVAGILIVFELLRLGAFDIAVRIIGGYMVVTFAFAVRVGEDLIKAYHSDDDDGNDPNGKSTIASLQQLDGAGRDPIAALYGMLLQYYRRQVRRMGNQPADIEVEPVDDNQDGVGLNTDTDPLNDFRGGED